MPVRALNACSVRTYVCMPACLRVQLTPSHVDSQLAQALNWRVVTDNDTLLFPHPSRFSFESADHTEIPQAPNYVSVKPAIVYTGAITRTSINTHTRTKKNYTPGSCNGGKTYDNIYMRACVRGRAYERVLFIRGCDRAGARWVAGCTPQS